MLILKISFLKNIILIYFQIKNTLKNNFYNISKYKQIINMPREKVLSIFIHIPKHVDKPCCI